MPELIRSAVSRVHLYFKDRRQCARLRTRLVFTVSIVQSINGHRGSRPAKCLKGHTRDISVDGLALLVPQICLNGHHLATEGRELEVKLEVGSEPPIRILVMPRRYERLEEAELGCGYLIGARIVQIEETDRIRYLNFINEGLQASRDTPASLVK